MLMHLSIYVGYIYNSVLIFLHFPSNTFSSMCIYTLSYII